MSGHTPGPWEMTKAGFDRHLIRHALTGKDHVPGYIAEVNNIGSSFNANARLIAAAPELLEALIALYDDALELDIEKRPLYVAARAAIARATGESP